jgi:predicted KAP-like P-loop ATPase
MLTENAISDAKQDRLGFSSTADHLAKVFTENDLSKGFVIGVEGAWGSGKSSLVNMAFKQLSSDKRGPIPIKFAPWLIGDRESLLWELFKEIERAVLDQTPAGEKEDTKKAFANFEAISRGGAKLAGFGSLLGFPGLGELAKILTALEEASNGFASRTC